MNVDMRPEECALLVQAFATMFPQKRFPYGLINKEEIAQEVAHLRGLVDLLESSLARHIIDK